jgi:tRNA-dihydrouridine synthase B
VPKIAKHNAGCSLMREPEHAATVIGAMVKAVRIPVTVKMRAGWNDRTRNAPDLARMVQDVGASAVAIHGRTAEQSYTGLADWALVSQIAEALTIPVFGSGDCVEADQIIARMQSGVSGVLVGRGVLRNPWILSQAAAMAAGRTPLTIPLEERGRFLLEYIELLLHERENEADGFRHVAPGSDGADVAAPVTDLRRRERWVVNKLRALCAWYSKGLDGGSGLRVRINAAANVNELRMIIGDFFLAPSQLPAAADEPLLSRR